MLSSFVFSNNEALACAKHAASNSQTISESQEVVEDQKQESTGHCCCKHVEQNDDQPFTPCGNCECNCVQSVSYISSEFSMEINLISITSYFTYGWHYNQPMPDKPMNSIWQPPQLS